MENNTPRIFEHPTFGAVRVFVKDGAPWFVGSDVAKALGYAKPTNAVAEHCKKSIKSTITLNQGDGKIAPPVNILVVPESDVYRLVMRSNLPSAEVFQDWVCEQVLPRIRKTGSYIGGIALPDFSDPACAARAWAEQYEEKVKAQRESEARLKALTMTSEALAITSKALDNTTNAKNEAIEIAEHAYQHQNEINDRRTATALGRNGGYVADRNRWKEAAAELVKEKETLQEQVGNAANWKQAKAIPWLSKAFTIPSTAKSSNRFYAALGKVLSALSKKKGVETRKIPDTSFGTIKAYSIQIINYAQKHLISFCKEKGDEYAKYLMTLRKKDFWKE